MLVIVVDRVEPEPRAEGWDSGALARAISTIKALAAPETTEVVSLDSLKLGFEGNDLDGVTWCPLTAKIELGELPEQLRSHPSLVIASRCDNIAAHRQEISSKVGCEIGAGTFWLPVVVTARGPLYAEAIAWNIDSKSYQQPFHLSDRQRQGVYRLARQVLGALDAPPAVYLLSLGLEAKGKDIEKIWFDRVLPFPGEPAIASLGVQTPDLFECHWRCITGQSLRDITI
ncbi:MAG: hypothetical protein AAF889_06070 [Cyanobacteria bacterium P01_D01_bin.73]